VIPFFKGRLITRTIFPVTSQPDLASESGSTFGLGDITFTAFYTPEYKGGIFWGFGPAINIPTAKQDIGVGE